MRVGLDLLFLIPGRTGGRETYARELIAAMHELEPALEITAFVSGAAAPGLRRELSASMRVVRLPVSPDRPEQWAVGELLLLPVAAARAGVQIVHSMANFGPAAGPFARVLTLHDLQYRAVPGLVPPVRRAGTAAVLGLAARHAHRVIAVSEFSREQAIGELGLEPERVEVVPNGVGAVAAIADDDVAALRDLLGLVGRPVVLSVASDLPHKNLDALVEAIARIDPERRPLLVFVGPGTDGPRLAETARLAGVLSDTRRLGYVAAPELEGLYRLAACVVLPTLYEGFGIPALEAMARGVPLACSDIPALREVTGDAALRFAPNHAEETAGAIERLLSDQTLTERLRTAGRQRATQFSWSRAARTTLGCYRRALGAAGAPAR